MKTYMVTLLVFLIAIGLGMTPVWAATPDGQEDICTSPAVIFCDNVEARALGSSDLPRATYKNTGWGLSYFGSDMVVTNTPAGVYYGRRALEFRYPAGGGGIGFMGTYFPAPYRTLYFRWYQKWSTGFAFSPIATKGASIWTAGSGQSLYFWWNNWGDGIISQWANPVATELQANMNGAFVPVRDRWYCLELRVSMNTEINADGYVQGWVDGVQRWEYPNVLLDPMQPNDMTSWILSGYWNCLTIDCSAPQDQHPLMYRWHDNFVISTQRIGCLGGPELFRDDFADGVADGWTISPLGNAAGWRVVDGVYAYDGGGHTQSYRGDPSWSDYTLEVKFRLATLSNYPGGIRGRVDPATGAGYAVWLYPATGRIGLFRAAAWHIDSPGLALLGEASGIPFDTSTFHTLRATFAGSVIEVYYDGILVIRATDAAYTGGVIALDVSNQPIEFDDVVVTREVPPKITAVSPPSGSTAGGTTVDITGSDFTAGSTVQIGGVRSTDVVVNNAGWISAVTPPSTAGAADVTVSKTAGTAVLPGGFTYLVPGSELLRDDFADGVADGWTISPLGNAAGWRVVDGVYTYDGGGHTQSYRGDPSWSEYTLEVKFRLATLSNYPGGIRGRVNPATGAGYAVWLYPATGRIGLFRAAAWHIDSPGLALLGEASGIPFDTSTFHTLRATFAGSVIEVYYDGILVIRATDAAYTGGVIALDVSNQPIEFDDVVVTALP